MKVYIDGQDYSEILGAAGAASILSAVRGEMTRTGRVVTEIQADGVVMDEDAFLNVTGALSARFSSQPVRDLVRESLDEALAYVPRLTGGLENIALHFEENEIPRGQGLLADAAEGLDWLLSVFQHCSSLLADEEGSRREDLESSLSDCVNTVGALHGEKKYLQLALCLRQRLIPEVEKLAVYLRRLRDMGTSIQ
ncbi:MAG: hypothetical protein LBL51_01175 [Synergistaceae bacterium]|jgi:hypothetical protein|nr:hypothetical protein [Synergistaceae bacterium]